MKRNIIKSICFVVALCISGAAVAEPTFSFNIGQAPLPEVGRVFYINAVNSEEKSYTCKYLVQIDYGTLVGQGTVNVPAHSSGPVTFFSARGCVFCDITQRKFECG